MLIFLLRSGQCIISSCYKKNLFNFIRS